MRASSALLVAFALFACKAKPTGAPTGSLVTVASGLPLAQAPSAASRSGRRDADDACEDASIEPRAGLPEHYVALPQLYVESDTGYVRLPQVVRIGPLGCDVVAVFTEQMTAPLHTGFGSDVPGVEGASQAAGFLFELVEAGDELWLFANTSRGFWRIDVTSGAITHDGSLDRFAVGRVSDGDGGAWLATAAELSDGMDVLRPAQLWHLDEGGEADADPVDLPFPSDVVGFVGGDDQGRLAMFVFHAVAVAANGHVWALDSTHATLHDVTAGASHHLDLVYPTGLVAWNDGLLVSAGIDRIEEGDTGGPVDPNLAQTPGVHWFDPATGSLSAVAEVPAPAAGWEVGGGFASGDMDGAEGYVILDFWYPMARVGDALIVADPGWGRLMVLEP